MNMKTCPLVSVVIPSYNRGYCIEDCIHSALAQGYPNFEIVVVDDASTDDTRSRVEAIDDPRVRFVAHEHNLGGGAARNTGIEHSGGEYIAFLDSDDRWMPQKLERQMQGLLSGGEAYGFSYTWLLCVDTKGRELARVNPEFDGDCHQQILVTNFIGTFSNVVIRRDLLSIVGCLDVAMRSCQDWDLFIRLLRLTQVHCQREYLVFYRQSSGDDVRISLNPRAVVQGHRRILHKFAAEYRALPRSARRQALRGYFNIFVGIGAFGQAMRTGAVIAFERAGPLALPGLLGGLVRAAKNAVQRKWIKFRLQMLHTRGVTR